MNTISYAITVKDEFEEIQRLLPFLLKNKRDDDEVVILWDDKGSSDVENYLRANCQESQPKYLWSRGTFNNDFAEWKNLLNSLCDGDFIFQIDADEIITKEFMETLPEILDSNPQIDFYWVARENYVKEITSEYIQKWGWRIDSMNRINYPDKQGRIYRNNPHIVWEGKVHEHIVGYKMYGNLPEVTELSINHTKTLEKQISQNNYYQTI